MGINWDKAIQDANNLTYNPVAAKQTSKPVAKPIATNPVAAKKVVAAPKAPANTYLAIIADGKKKGQSPEQIAARLKAFGAYEQEQYSNENGIRQFAKDKKAENEQWKAAHPVLGMINTYSGLEDANNTYLNLLEKYGGNAPLSETIKAYGTMGFQGGLGMASTLPIGGLASNGFKAVAMGTKALKAGKTANAARRAVAAEKVINKKPILRAGQGAANMSAAFAAPEAAHGVNSILNGSMTPKEAIDNTLHSAGLGAITGATAGVASPALGAVTGVLGKTIAQPVANTVAKQAMKSQMVKNVVVKNMTNNALKKLEEKGIEATPEMLTQIGEQAEKAAENQVSQYLKGITEAAVTAVPHTTFDTAVLGATDFGLQALQGQKQFTPEDIMQQVKDYAPFVGMAALSPAMKAASPAFNAYGRFYDKHFGRQAGLDNLLSHEITNSQKVTPEQLQTIENAKEYTPQESSFVKGLINGQDYYVNKENEQIAAKQKRYNERRQEKARRKALKKQYLQEQRANEQAITLYDINPEYLSAKKQKANTRKDVSNSNDYEYLDGKKVQVQRLPYEEPQERIGVGKETTMGKENIYENVSEANDPLVKLSETEHSVERLEKLQEQNSRLVKKAGNKKTVKKLAEQRKLIDAEKARQEENARIDREEIEKETQTTKEDNGSDKDYGEDTPIDYDKEDYMSEERAVFQEGTRVIESADDGAKFTPKMDEYARKGADVDSFMSIWDSIKNKPQEYRRKIIKDYLNSFENPKEFEVMKDLVLEQENFEERNVGKFRGLGKETQKAQEPLLAEDGLNIPEKNKRIEYGETTSQDRERIAKALFNITSVAKTKKKYGKITVDLKGDPRNYKHSSIEEALQMSLGKSKLENRETIQNNYDFLYDAITSSNDLSPREKQIATDILNNVMAKKEATLKEYFGNFDGDTQYKKKEYLGEKEKASKSNRLKKANAQNSKMISRVKQLKTKIAQIKSEIKNAEKEGEDVSKLKETLYSTQKQYWNAEKDARQGISAMEDVIKKENVKYEAQEAYKEHYKNSADLKMTKIDDLLSDLDKYSKANNRGQKEKQIGRKFNDLKNTFESSKNILKVNYFIEQCELNGRGGKVKIEDAPDGYEGFTFTDNKGRTKSVEYVDTFDNTTSEFKSNWEKAESYINDIEKEINKYENIFNPELSKSKNRENFINALSPSTVRDLADGIIAYGKNEKGELLTQDQISALRRLRTSLGDKIKVAQGKSTIGTVYDLDGDTIKLRNIKKVNLDSLINTLQRAERLYDQETGAFETQGVTFKDSDTQKSIIYNYDQSKSFIKKVADAFVSGVDENGTYSYLESGRTFSVADNVDDIVRKSIYPNKKAYSDPDAKSALRDAMNAIKDSKDGSLKKDYDNSDRATQQDILLGEHVKQVCNAIEKYCGDYKIVTSKDLSDGSNAKVDFKTKTILLSTNIDKNRIYKSMAHELHHAVTYEIALEKGVNSSEYKEFVKASNANKNWERILKDSEYENAKFLVNELVQMKKFGASDYVIKKEMKEFAQQEPKFQEAFDARKAYFDNKVEKKARLAAKGVWVSFGKYTNDLKDFEAVKANKPILDSARAYLEEAQKRTDRTGYKYDSPTKRENWVNNYCNNSPKGNDPEYRKRVLDRFNKSIELLRQEKNGTLKNRFEYKGFGEYGGIRRNIKTTQSGPRQGNGRGSGQSSRTGLQTRNRPVQSNRNGSGQGSSGLLSNDKRRPNELQTSKEEIKKKDNDELSLNEFKEFDEFSPKQEKRLNEYAKGFTTEIPKEKIRELGNYAYTARRTSQLTEKAKLELGLITKEEVKARKNLAGSKSVYVKYLNSNKVPQGQEKIRLGIKYHSNSYGIWGGKAGKMTAGRLDRMSASDTLKSIYLDSAKTQGLKKIMDYTYDNFAEPIENNRVKVGYVGVNKHLLNICKALDASPDFYALLDSNPNEIKKQFAHVDERQYYINIHNRTRNLDCQIPEKVFKKLLTGTGETAQEYWERYRRGNYGNLGTGIAKWAASVSDAYLDAFKKNVLSSASFFINNRGGNFNLIADVAKNPIELAKAYFDGAVNVKNKDIPQEFLSNSILEAVENSAKLKHYSGNEHFDNFANLFNGHLIDTKDLERRIKKTKKNIEIHGNSEQKTQRLKKLEKGLSFAKKANVLAAPTHLFNKLVPVIQEFNTKFENYERRVLYSMRINQARKDIIKKTGQQILTTKEGIKAVSANPELMDLMVKRVEDVIGDYNNFSPTERKILKRVVPFYSWYRTVYRHIKTLLKEDPARFGLILAQMDKMEKDESKKDLVNYQKMSFKTPLKDPRSGKQLVVNKAKQLIPIATYRSLLKGDFSGLSEEAISGISPLVKVPLEVAAGKKFFGRGEIKNSRYLLDRTGKYYDTKENKYIDKLPLSTTLGYGTKELLKHYTPLLSNNAIKGESLLTAAANYNKNGKFIEPDLIYDSGFGGAWKGDKAGKLERYSANNLSQETKTLNRLGLTLQNETIKNSVEKERKKKGKTIRRSNKPNKMWKDANKKSMWN